MVSMLPRLNDHVLLGEQRGVVLATEGDHLLTVRLDDGVSGQLGSSWELTWRPDATTVLGVRTVVVERLLVDDAPAVRLHPNGEVTRVQRREYVRVPLQREIRLVLDPVPLDPAVLGLPRDVTGLTLDIAEASVRCSLRARDAPAYVVGAGVRAGFRVGGESVDLPGAITRVEELTDEEPPRVELVVMLAADESARTALRRALFAEQVRLRADRTEDVPR